MSVRAKGPRRAEVVHEHGPFADGEAVHGVSFDGERVWYATGDRLRSFDPESGAPGRELAVAADAGTAFDGRHLYQLAGGLIQKVDPASGAVLATVPSPCGEASAGLTWAEGDLWVAEHRARKIHRLDPETGALRSTIEAARYVTGVTFVDGELWHATWEDGRSDLRRVDPRTGDVLDVVEMPAGQLVSGLESDGGERLFCGGATSGKIRVVRRPRST